MDFLKKKFKDKKVLITGHTGFKGSWLSFWFVNLGAKVLGISDNYSTQPSLFSLLKLKNKIIHRNYDLLNFKKIKKEIINFKPDFVFHLAAQAIVKKSYKNPKKTFETNSFGTLNLLETLRFLKKKCNIIIITSDKSYRNVEKKEGYIETDILGGDDPYSASKASAEMIIRSYMNCFFKNKKNLSIAVARAGNVIGGGDWSPNRIVPDCFKTWSQNKIAIIRNPNSTRPWQHVFEVLGGYILLSIFLDKKRKFINNEVFNFGPSNNQIKSVLDLVREMKKNWPRVKWRVKKNKNFFEHKLLKLNSSKIKKIINWRCILPFKETVFLTSDWYKTFYKNKKNIVLKSALQLREYQSKIEKIYF